MKSARDPRRGDPECGKDQDAAHGLDGEGWIEMRLDIAALRDERSIDSGACHRLDECEREQRDAEQADLGGAEKPRADDRAQQAGRQRHRHAGERPGAAGAQPRPWALAHSRSIDRNSSWNQCVGDSRRARRRIHAPASGRRCR